MANYVDISIIGRDYDFSRDKTHVDLGIDLDGVSVTHQVVLELDESHTTSLEIGDHAPSEVLSEALSTQPEESDTQAESYAWSQMPERLYTQVRIALVNYEDTVRAIIATGNQNLKSPSIDRKDLDELLAAREALNHWWDEAGGKGYRKDTEKNEG